MINLGGELVFSPVGTFRARRILFVFVMGYDVWAVPEPYARLLRLEKPVNVGHIAQALTIPQRVRLAALLHPLLSWVTGRGPGRWR